MVSIRSKVKELDLCVKEALNLEMIGGSYITAIGCLHAVSIVYTQFTNALISVAEDDELKESLRNASDVIIPMIKATEAVLDSTLLINGLNKVKVDEGLETIISVHERNILAITTILDKLENKND